MVAKALNALGQFLIYMAMLLAVNAMSASHAADTEYDAAYSSFQKRDIVSISQAVVQLEKMLEKKADNVDAQALLAFAYAHQAYLGSQFGRLDNKSLAAGIELRPKSINQQWRTYSELNACKLKNLLRSTLRLGIAERNSIRFQE